MSISFRILIPTITAWLLFSACGKKEEASSAEALKPADPVESPEKGSSSDSLTQGLEDMKQAKGDTETSETLNAGLADQAIALRSQYQSNSKDLRTQFNSLSTKFNSIKDRLPGDIANAFSERLPKLDTSLSELEALAAKFLPSSLEEIEAFKAEYEKEFAIAKQLTEELITLLENSSINEKLPGF